MKIKQLILLMFASMFLVNMVSAYQMYHFNRYSDELNNHDNVLFVIKYPESYNPEESWNLDRYSTYEYRNGYSYRTTQEYSAVRKRIDQTENNFRKKLDNSGQNTFYIYNEPLRSYEEHQCYNQAPSDKLFYIKCK